MKTYLLITVPNYKQKILQAHILHCIYNKQNKVQKTNIKTKEQLQQTQSVMISMSNVYAYCNLVFHGLYNLSFCVVLIIELAITLIINVLFRVGLHRLMIFLSCTFHQYRSFYLQDMKNRWKAFSNIIFDVLCFLNNSLYVPFYLKSHKWTHSMIEIFLCTILSYNQLQ